MIPELLLYGEAIRLGDLFHAYADSCPFTGILEIKFVNSDVRMKLANGITIIHQDGGVWYERDGQLFRTFNQAHEVQHA